MTFYIGIPQLIFVLFVVISLVQKIIKRCTVGDAVKNVDGKIISLKKEASTDLGSYIISQAILLGLMYWGGFFG